jgi:hypothetical protein
MEMSGVYRYIGGFPGSCLGPEPQRAKQQLKMIDRIYRKSCGSNEMRFGHFFSAIREDLINWFVRPIERRES